MTYLVVILAVGAPLIAVEWVVGHAQLRFEWRPLVAAVVAATIYLGAAHLAAVNDGAYDVNRKETIGLNVGDFVFEEWLFLLVANTVVAQFVVLVLDEDWRRRWLRVR